MHTNLYLNRLPKEANITCHYPISGETVLCVIWGYYDL